VRPRPRDRKRSLSDDFVICAGVFVALGFLLGVGASVPFRDFGPSGVLAFGTLVATVVLASVGVIQTYYNRRYAELLDQQMIWQLRARLEWAGGLAVEGDVFDAIVINKGGSAAIITAVYEGSPDWCPPDEPEEESLRVELPSWGLLPVGRVNAAKPSRLAVWYRDAHTDEVHCLTGESRTIVLTHMLRRQLADE